MRLFISIAEHPGNLGTTLFNAAFEAKRIKAIYKACQVAPSDLAAAVKGVRALGISGCSVTMPFKTKVLPYLDVLDPTAAKIGAVNTIINDRGRLTGYNTDYVGALTVLRRIRSLPEKKIVLLGAGGVAQAIGAALHTLHARKVTVVNRLSSPARALIKKWHFQDFKPWARRNELQGDILINATPIGMSPYTDEMPITRKGVDKYKLIMDVVVSPLHTKLIKTAKARGKQTISGYEMNLAQTVRQFELYTGQKAPPNSYEA